MSWNYRVIRKKKRLKGLLFTYFDVHEVYYDKKGRPSSWTKEPVSANGFESLKELQNSQVMIMADILKYPVLKIIGNRLVQVKE